jgi:hypothetical protein
MAKPVPGDPTLDDNVVGEFTDAGARLAAAVGLLDDEVVRRNLGQKSTDEIEVVMRKARVGIDRGLIALVAHGTIRTAQMYGGLVGSLTARVARLEEVAAAREAVSTANETSDDSLAHDESDMTEIDECVDVSMSIADVMDEAADGEIAE